MRFRKKTIEVEAAQWHGGWFGEVLPGCMIVKDGRHDHMGVIETPGGPRRVNPHDWIIKSSAGEFFPYRPDIFAATYEPVEPTP